MPILFRPRIRCPSRRRSTLRWRMSATVDVGSPRVAAASFWVVVRQRRLEAEGVAGLRGGPGDELLDPAVGRAADLARGVVDADGEAADGDIAYGARATGPSGELAPPATLRAAGPVLVGLHAEVQDALQGLYPEPDDGEGEQSEELAKEGTFGGGLTFCHGAKCLFGARP